MLIELEMLATGRILSYKVLIAWSILLTENPSWSELTSYYIIIPLYLPRLFCALQHAYRIVKDTPGLFKTFILVVLYPFLPLGFAADFLPFGKLIRR
jgi:hypothetical protein